MSLRARIAWLAFCSSPCLKGEGHHIYPPSDLWKELIRAPSGLNRRLFQDDLGLPEFLDLYTTNGQPIVQYRVTKSTNYMEWTFPLEFHLAEYCPARTPSSRYLSTNGWSLEFTATGRVTAIGPGPQPEPPLPIPKH